MVDLSGVFGFHVGFLVWSNGRTHSFRMALAGVSILWIRVELAGIDDQGEHHPCLMNHQ